MNKITQITEKMLSKFFDLKITDGISSVIEGLNRAFKEFCNDYIALQLEELDEIIFKEKSLRRGWDIIHKDVPRTLVCEYGSVEYKRRYYKNRETGCKAHLVDILAGIEKGSKIEASLAIKLVELSTEHSYEKSSKIACNNAVSKQSVMNKTRQAGGYELPETEVKKGVKEIHIQADEDHVSMQDGRNVIVKLITVHEPRKYMKKKAFLPNKVHYVAYKERPEELWDRVSEDIYNRYRNCDDLKIYLHGDGANWIKSGLKWFPGSIYLLDRFHLHKYINKISKDNFRHKSQIFKYLRNEDYKALKVFIDTIVSNDEVSEKTGDEVYTYLKNNREGIKNLLSLESSKTKTCAEAQVSHVLSERLSSRPRGWMDDGLETISQLRVFKLNGGKLTPENFVKKDSVIAEHTSKIRKMRTNAAPYVSNKNYDISRHITKRRYSHWLKELAKVRGII